jgi:flagellar biosynthesis anti-sigma factor FlgM
MRINDRYQRFLERVGPGTSKPATQVRGKEASETKPGAALAVKVSERAQELATRADRVDELKSAIAAGTYRVDAKAIASRLLDGES